MITGRRAFDGPNPASVAGAVLHVAPPPLTTVVSVTPPALERLVAVCLSKSPDDRWSSAHDVLLQLRALSPGEVHLPASPGRSASRERVAWGLAAALGAVAAAVLLVPRPGVPGMAPGGLDVVSILPPEGAVPSYAWEAPQVSPDGRQIAVAATDPSGTNWLYVRGRDSLESRRLPGTEDATLPFWSPDSTQLGFFAAGQLKTVALAGGAPSVLAAAPVPRGGTWNADNVILFSAVPNSPPGLVAATGGEVRLAPAPAEAGFRSFPQWLPDGRHYIYQALDAASRRPDVLRAASIDTTDVNDIVTARGHGVLRSGFLLYRRDSALVAQPFDVATRQLTGTPSIVADQVGLNAITYQSLFSASTDAIAFLPSPHASQLFWLDRQGRVLDTLTPPGDYNTVCLTADGRRAVFDRADASTGAVDLWQLDIDTHQSSRLTFDAAVDFHPVCSPSGPSSQDVIFASLRAGPPSLFRLPIGAPGSEKAVLTTPPAAKIPSEWTRDGRWIVFSVLNAKTSWDIAMWPVEGGEPTPVVATQADEHTGRVSPDGRWIAYAAKEPGGQFEIYAQPFPGGGAKWQVSRGGGKQPYWRADGAELYYLTPDRKLMAVPVGLRQGVLAFGEGRALMETRVAGWETINSVGRQYAVSADGQRFLVSATSGAATPITLMLNWAAKTAR
jgi:Tol biopolymer transport system component